jgi:cell division protein FtsL
MPLNLQDVNNMLITTILILTIFALLMDGYYVTNDIAKVSEKAQAHSAECQKAQSHKVVRYLSASSDIMDITTAKELLALHTVVHPNAVPIMPDTVPNLSLR